MTPPFYTLCDGQSSTKIACVKKETCSIEATFYLKEEITAISRSPNKKKNDRF